MYNHTIDKAEYKKYFDNISRLIKGQQVELEVTGLDIGNQIETEWVTLEGFSYDPKDEILVVHTPNLNRMVNGMVQSRGMYDQNFTLWVVRKSFERDPFRFNLVADIKSGHFKLDLLSFSES